MYTFLCAILVLFCFAELSFAKEIPYEGSVEEKIPEFRYDYTYIGEIDGWLKLHRLPAKWKEARNRCKLEGGELATPLDRPMLEAMINVMKNQMYRSIFTGIHSMFSYGDYYSVKGVSLERMPVSWTKWGPSYDIDKRCVVFMPNGTITNDYCNDASHPYICYKRNINETVGPCGTVDKKYIYVPDIDNCYKIHARRTTWYDAFMTCSAEGGHLVVMNSDKEFKSVVSLLASYPQEIKENVFVGIVDNDKSGQWTTIHDDNLDESGFEKWLTGEPNHGANEFCGSFIRGEGYNDMQCDAKLPFVCEKKTDSLIKEIDIFDITNFFRSAV
ncbi:secretory phospholipase A2 receptor-like [Epargyreus clarus]|uniref:secretory phospholipase A2 receptor-like n=1 Tax=Epargyreus clarus TaxID=520877 RepID=UPI003C2B6B55